ncbi:MAG: hypothetical protein LBB89_07825 [Treponema sp.]|jgi:hypothetical protein|nr:hypothetical protein [Treponema sp.]
MKKLIAISVVFALVAGAAFAADVGVEVIGKVDLANGSTAKNVVGDSPKPGTDYSGRLRVSAGGENDDGTFGGWFRYESGISGAGDSAYAHAWWKPIEQVKMTIGTNEDGWFGLDGVTRWGFYQVAGDVGIANAGNAWGGGYTALGVTFSSAFFGGWTNGLWLNIVPMEALEINIGIPYGGDLRDVYPKSNVQVAYTADGIGKFGLTYVGGLGHRDPVAPKLYLDPGAEATEGAWDWAVVVDGDDVSVEWVQGEGKDAIGPSWKLVGAEGAVDDPSKIYLYVGLTMIENLSIDIGFGYTFPISSGGITRSAPIAAGLGAHFTAGDFGVKARTVAAFMGKTSGGEGEAIKDPMEVLFDVMPYYAISESLTAHFSLGVGYKAKQDKNDNDYAKMGFHAAPYITIKSSWWAPNLYAGIRLETNGKKFKDGGETKDGATYMNWCVPIGIVFAY